MRFQNRYHFRKNIYSLWLMTAMVPALTSCGTTVTSNKYEPFNKSNAAAATSVKPHAGRPPGKGARIGLFPMDSGRFEGIPYHLPTAQMNLDLTILRDANRDFKDITMRLTPEYVPDHEALFYLNPRTNSTFASKHTLRVENGLLTSVATVDDGQAGDLLVSLVDTAITLKKAGVARGLAAAQSETKSPFLTDSKTPTAGEIDHALSLIQGDSLSFQFAIEAGSLREDLPGTSGLLYLNSRATPVGSALDFAADSTDHSGTFAGVYTRTVQPANTSIEVYMDADKLRALRSEAFKKAIEAQEQGIEKQKAARAKQNSELCEDDEVVELKRQRKNYGKKLDLISSLKAEDNITQARLNSLNSRADDVREYRERVIAEINKCDGKKSTLDSTDRNIKSAEQARDKNIAMQSKLGEVLKEDFLIKQTGGVALIPDRSRTVRVPLDRAAIGETRNTLAFNKGVLTDYTTEREAAAVVVAQSANSVAQAILRLPAELIQLRFNIGSQQAEATEQQLELLNKQAELEARQQELAGELTEIQRVDQQIELLKRRIALKNEQETLNPTRTEVDSINQQLEVLQAQQELSSAQSQAEVDALNRQIQELQAQRSLVTEQVDVPVLDQLSQQELLLEKQRDLLELQKEIEELTSDIAESE